jgi:hypothetical protein
MTLRGSARRMENKLCRLVKVHSLGFGWLLIWLGIYHDMSYCAASLYIYSEIINVTLPYAKGCGLNL